MKMNEPNVQSTCRFCLQMTELSVDIFSDSAVLQKLATFFPFLMEHSEEDYNSISSTTPKMICLSCKEIVTNFYDFYRMVQVNQSLLTEYTKKMQSNPSIVEEEQSQRFSLTIHAATDDDALINSYGTLEYSLNEEVCVDSNQPENYEKNAPQNYVILNENSVNFSSDSRLVGEQNEEMNMNNANRMEAEENSETVPILFSRKNIDEKLPDHLKVRTSKEKSDAQIKEFVNLICDICNTSKPFDSFKELQEHYRLDHNQRGYVECCDKKFYRKDRLMNHITNHIYPDAFKCTTCGQNSKSKVLLRIHMKQHLPTDLRPFHCQKCPQKFVLKSQLTNHEASHLTQDQKKFVCDTCGKAFALKFVMIKHKLTHSEKINFVCEICAKQFCSKTNLQSHMAHHLQEKSPRVQCLHCNLWYKNVETLRTHMQRHKDDRQHICNVCSKECTTSSSLSAHIRYVHLKIKDFECSMCEKKFRRKLELTEHMARHTGQALYICQFCPKTFTSSSNYFSHRKYRHPAQLAEFKAKKDE